MTDEEKAMEYCGCNQPICRKGFETKDKQNCTCARKQIYLDGLEEGQKEGILGMLDKCEEFRHKANELEQENAELKEKHESDKKALKLIVEKGVKLEKDNAELSNSVTELTNTKTELESKVTELEKQIQRMKCCGNCKYCEISEDWALFCTKDDRGAFRPYHCDSWELWEKKE